MSRKVQRTRNAETWTEAQFWGKIRAMLRRLWWMYWQPRKDALSLASRKHTGTGRHKKEYQCAVCSKFFKAKEVDVHHKTPCGRLKSADDLKPFVERLFCEDTSEYEVLCKACHKNK